MSTPVTNIILLAPTTVSITKIDTDTDTEFNKTPGVTNIPIRLAVCDFPGINVTDSDYIQIRVGGNKIVTFLNTQKGK